MYFYKFTIITKAEETVQININSRNEDNTARNGIEIFTNLYQEILNVGYFLDYIKTIVISDELKN